jgi:hypothetical protein
MSKGRSKSRREKMKEKVSKIHFKANIRTK